MKKIIILIPIFNDWDSLKKLIFEINRQVKDLTDYLFDCYIINDGSTIKKPEIIKPESLNSIKILNMRKNKGHARCIAFGIRYINQNMKFDNLILMDGDGEDRPEEIKSLIHKIESNSKISVVAKRVKRSEGFLFQLLYKMHKLLTFIFTGKNINFGNYSCLTKEDVSEISSKKSLWSSYSGTIKKYINNLSAIDSTRGRRYFGPSKMSLYNLIIHSFSIIAVFKYQALIRSSILVLTIFYLKSYLGVFTLIIQIILIIFCILIFLVSLREKKKELFISHKNLNNIEDI